MTVSRVHLILPRSPSGKRETWDALREELRTYNLHLTVLGLTPQGRPHIKLVGSRNALRRWLDQAGYKDVEVP